MTAETVIESGRGAWGRLPHQEQRLVDMPSRWDRMPSLAKGQTMLARGNGRSYGDVALNSHGVLLDMRSQNHFIEFDTTTGLLTCEAGVQMGEILDLAMPHGWFLHVTPGTRFATVGGAIANDVHGKNHHRAGGFGIHVQSLELLRSTGERIQCSRSERPEMFRATIGGIGLTGAITSATMSLKRVSSEWIAVESQSFDTLQEFLVLSAAADTAWEYTVAWVDAVGPSQKVGRGVFFRGNHATAKEASSAKERKGSELSIPFDLPFALVNPTTVGLFNASYFQRHRKPVRETVAYGTFFYPLDGIHNWNRMYGPRGFYQYQCVVPIAEAQDNIQALLSIAAESGWPSFLAVLKLFGKTPAAGCLSFPMEGITLALDFPNHGEPLMALFNRMDAIVREAGGRVYAAKDARMSRETFLAGQPAMDDFMPHIDPGVDSDFWQRVRPTPRKTTCTNPKES